MAFEFTDQNFKEQTAKGFVVVDFTAPWCGPCKMMAPIFDALAEEYNGKVKMGKLVVDDNPEVPNSFGISGVPTILFFKEGELVGRLVGFQSKESLVAKMKESFGI